MPIILTVVEPALYRLRTFQVTSLLSFFRCLGRTRLSVQFRSFRCKYFATWYVFTVRRC